MKLVCYVIGRWLKLENIVFIFFYGTNAVYYV
jgi:hypothetical protein